MENTPRLVLSDYQAAILNEMGISSWQLVEEQQSQLKNEIPSPDPDPNLRLEAVATSSEVISKEDALVKLSQLKVTTHTSEATDSVLVSFLPTDTKSYIFTDVLIALGLDAKSQKHISADKLDDYRDYPLSWTQGEKVSFTHKQLMTPALAELQHSDIKKQLWQRIQSASLLQNFN
ncbi:MAG: DNA polymerase III subunit psi [Paraglaciecola sp.]|nr:DNA polymerase III subunit psi [Paraglaciecola sp.]